MKGKNAPEGADDLDSKQEEERKSLERQEQSLQREMKSELSSLQKEIAGSTTVEQKGTRESEQDASEYLESELQKIESVTKKPDQSLEKVTSSGGGKFSKDSVANTMITGNVTKAHQTIDGLNRPEAEKGLKDSYDEAQDAITDMMGNFFKGKNLGLFS